MGFLDKLFGKKTDLDISQYAIKFKEAISTNDLEYCEKLIESWETKDSTDANLRLAKAMLGMKNNSISKSEAEDLIHWGGVYLPADPKNYQWFLNETKSLFRQKFE